MLSAFKAVGICGVAVKPAASLVTVFSVSPSLLAVTTQRYKHERGALSEASATSVAPVASRTSLQSSPVALSCHWYDSVSPLGALSRFVVAVYVTPLPLPATVAPKRGVTDTVASALGSSSVVNVSA